MKEYYVYIVKDTETMEFYIGCRGFKGDPVDDKYLGSPYTWKPNIENLVKTIIKKGFKNMSDAMVLERSLIIENINNKLNRNYSIPYSRFNRSDLITAKDKNGRIVSINKNDPLFGVEFFGITKGKVLVRDSDNNVFYVDKDDFRYKSGILIHNNKGRMNSGESHLNYGKKQINDGINQKLVSCDEIDDYIKKGWKIGTLQKNKTTNSSHCNKAWISKDKINKRVNKSDLEYYLNLGWSIGRKNMKKYEKRK